MTASDCLIMSSHLQNDKSAIHSVHPPKTFLFVMLSTRPQSTYASPNRSDHTRFFDTYLTLSVISFRTRALMSVVEIEYCFPAVSMHRTASMLSIAKQTRDKAHKLFVNTKLH